MLGIVPLACLALLLSPGSARAGFITYQASGSDSDGTLIGTAQFSTQYDSGTHTATITITLTNNLTPSAYGGQGQAISSLQFTLGSAPTGLTGTPTDSGQLVDIGSGGTVTTVSGTPDRWVSTSGGDLTLSGSTITLAVAGKQVSSGNPTEMIIGLPDSKTGTYPNVNSGGGSNGQFDPYVEGSATFTITISGVNADPTITSAKFGFGTGPDTNMSGTTIPGVVVPEPSSLALVAVGFVTLGLTRLRRWRRAPPAAVA
jgi:hypothetical protein